uniref:J domain-containing protein n=1 Tax=Arcella intermedia TaxID=1963864 RepID=A0A6B2LEW1_9EUKA
MTPCFQAGPLNSPQRRTFSLWTPNTSPKKPTPWPLQSVRYNTIKASATEIFGNQVASDFVCWYCGSTHPPVTGFFCDECGYVQPLSCVRCSFFDFFSLPASFEIDTKLLQDRFRQLQKKLHPDRFTRKSEKERKFSQEQSSSLNTAYKILSHDLLRAQYMLKLRGHDVLAEGKTLLDPELLAEVLEVREDLDNADTLQDIQKVSLDNQIKYSKIVKELAKNFAESDFDSAKKNTIHLQYISKIKEEADARLSKLQ